MLRPLATTRERRLSAKRWMVRPALLWTVSGRACRMKISPLAPS